MFSNKEMKEASRSSGYFDTYLCRVLDITVSFLL